MTGRGTGHGEAGVTGRVAGHEGTVVIASPGRPA